MLNFLGFELQTVLGCFGSNPVVRKKKDRFLTFLTAVTILKHASPPSSPGYMLLESVCAVCVRCDNFHHPQRPQSAQCLLVGSSGQRHPVAPIHHGQLVDL